MPAYYAAGKLPDRVWYRVGSDNRDSEIGLFTAWDARCIATGTAEDCDLAIKLAEATYQRHDWSDAAGIFRLWYSGPCKADPDLYCGNFSSGHYPNLFFLPYLISGDEKYILAMEAIYKGYQNLRKKNINGPIIHQSGRELAWNLRTLAQLAWLQKKGDIDGTTYIDAMEATRKKLLASTENPYQAALHVLGAKINTGSQQWTGWFEGYICQVINYVVLLGFEEWRPLAEWHFQQLKARAGGQAPMKYLDNDHVKSGLSWQETKLHNEERMTALAGWPDDELPNYKVNGTVITYYIRARIALAWCAMAVQSGIKDAPAVCNSISDAINRRGQGSEYQEFAIGLD